MQTATEIVDVDGVIRAAAQALDEWQTLRAELPWGLKGPALDPEWIGQRADEIRAGRGVDLTGLEG